MRFLLALVMCLISTSAYSAELLVKAKPHWMDSLKQDEIDKMSDMQKEHYNARSQVGDIIVVRPDGWKWGKEECLPNFIVVKVPGMTIEEAKKYEEQLTEMVDKDGKVVTKPTEAELKELVKDKAWVEADKAKQIRCRVLKVRKYAIPSADVSASLGTTTMNKTTLTNKLITKAE